MVNMLPWVERQWSFTLPVGAFPAVVERLAGTPARAAALVDGVPEAVLMSRPLGKWSIKEHLGHLSDLHTLDLQRVADFMAHAPVLTAADMSNRRTDERNHRETPIDRLLRALQSERGSLTIRLEALTEEDIATSALHPRLGVSMRLIDWAQFVADHDDHHLAAARTVLRVLGRMNRA